MDRSDLHELHYIAPIRNVRSILQLGILSHARASRHHHESVAMPEIQDIRATKSVPGGRPLHEYVNLYIFARNPMLRKRSERHADLCVLQVSPEVLDHTDTVVTDQNAASKYVRFAKAPEGLRVVDRDMVFAEWWTHPDDQILEWRHASIKCAEVLVPDRVSPRFIRGAYVSTAKARRALESFTSQLPPTVNPYLFFVPGAHP